MAGEARTSAFVIGEATVMIGPQADLWNLSVAEHSIGLVKNFSISAEPRYTELTQGVKNQIVYSVLTQNTVRATMEVYEFTSKNLTYGLGLDGSGITAVGAAKSLKTAITGSDSTPPTTATFDHTSSVVSDYPVGTWIMIQNGTGDDVHLAKLSAVTTVTGSGPFTHTVTFANQGVKAGGSARTFPVGSKIWKVNAVDVGSKAEQPFLAAKVVGILPEENRPAAIVIPKLRITKGFQMAWTSQNFGNLPFEFTPYELVSTDPFFSEFDGTGMARLLHGR